MAYDRSSVYDSYDSGSGSSSVAYLGIKPPVYENVYAQGALLFYAARHRFVHFKRLYRF